MVTFTFLWRVFLAISFPMMKAVEINLLDDFGINEGMDGIIETDGIAFEGKAFLFGDKKDNLVKQGDIVTEIAKQAKVYGELTVSANVKMDPNRECTLFWIETTYTRPVFGIWINCATSCKLTMLYMLHYKSYEVSFDNIGPLDDKEWHKLVVHINGMRKGLESNASVYVDCAKQGEKKLVTGYTHMLPFIRRKAISSQIWFAQRSRGKRGGFEKPWRGSLQNVQFIYNRNIEKLVAQTTCSNLKPKRAFYPPVVVPIPKEDQTTSHSNGEILAANTQHLEIILSNQVEETKYLRRLIENLHYTGFKKMKTCSLNPCYHGVTCTNTPYESPGYKCGKCPFSMEGDGIECKDIDECALNPCFSPELCQNTAVGFRCGPCPKGYRGGVVVGVGGKQAKRKQVCRDIDECAEARASCARFSECVNTVGSYKCGACPEGYYGDPYVECKVFLYCTKPKFNPCNLKADCIQKKEGQAFECKCKVGYVGDGIKCGLDSDLDGVPDYALACSGSRCSRDNCGTFPNPDQSDIDGDGKGDACDNDMDGDGVPNNKDNCPRITNGDQKDADGDNVGDVCDNCPNVPNKNQKNSDGDYDGDACDRDNDNDGFLNENDNCPFVVNERQEDKDSDGVGDACDNCPDKKNPNQEDVDHDFLGDVCDTDIDRDRDGVQDNLDNCRDDPNSSQLDNDLDGTGDVCDDDDDDDGIVDLHDNCPYLPNRFQKYSAWHGRGQICKYDYDGDTVKDKYDACPNDAKMTVVDFRDHFLFDPASGTNKAEHGWKVYNKGQEVREEIQPDGATMLIGNRMFESVEFKGTVFVDSNEGSNMIGLVFGFLNSKSFFVVSWKREAQHYWHDKPFEAKADAGLTIKAVKSVTGPSDALRNALWSSESVTNQTKIIWKDGNKTPWKYQTAYKWVLSLTTMRNRISIEIYDGVTKIISSPELRAWPFHGGRLGMFSFSQGKVIWTALAVKCL